MRQAHGAGRVRLSSFIRTFRKARAFRPSAPASDRICWPSRRGIRTGSASMSKRSRARANGAFDSATAPTAGGESHPAL